MKIVGCKKIIFYQFIFRHVSGSLSIEGYGMLLVDTVNGNYDSMTGFPMSRFYQEIMKYL